MKDNKDTLYIAGAIIGVGAVASVLGVVLGTFNTNTQTSASNTTSNLSSKVEQSQNSSVTPTNYASYKDGTYSANISYTAHGHSEAIKVTLSIASNAITSSSTSHSAGDRESMDYQTEFDATYKSYVVGKSLDAVKLTRVGGASDTTYAFMQAVQNIKNQAKNS